MTEEALSSPTSDIGSTPPGEPSRPRPRRWWPWITLIVAAIVIAVASRVNLDYYAVQPGVAQPVQKFIRVPADKGHPVAHPVLLTDVEVGRVSALSYLYYKFHGNTDLYPLESITGGSPPSEYTAQGDLEMSQAESAAKTAALRRLGYPVTAQPAGAVVSATYPKAPAYGLLNVGDVISAVDGNSTPNADSLVTALRLHHSGQSITLSVLGQGSNASSTPKPVTLTLKDTVIDTGGGVMQTEDLGVQVGNQVNYTYPFPVTINVADIGGPSAGLAIALGVIDALTGGSLTGGKTVATTGTIDDQGNVGDVGGVPQKTVAVENAGATIFLVPPQEYKAAKSKQGKGLQIYPVSTLDQALAVLAAHGGVVPPVLTNSTSATSTPA
jgi:PDZ domain-containing protein